MYFEIIKFVLWLCLLRYWSGNDSPRQNTNRKCSFRSSVVIAKALNKPHKKLCRWQTVNVGLNSQKVSKISNPLIPLITRQKTSQRLMLQNALLNKQNVNNLKAQIMFVYVRKARS